MRKVALVVVGTGEILDVVWKLSQQDLLMIESGMDVSDICDFGLRNGEKWIAIDWDGENSGKGVSRAQFGIPTLNLPHHLECLCEWATNYLSNFLHFLLTLCKPSNLFPGVHSGL